MRGSFGRNYVYCYKPADFKHHSVHESWNKSEYETEKEAIMYLHNWLGIYSPGIAALSHCATNGKEYDYSGYGDKVTIRKVDE